MMIKVPFKEEDTKILRALKEFAIFSIAAYITLIFDSLIFVTGAFYDNPYYIGILQTHLVIKAYISVLFGLMFVLAVRLIPDEKEVV